MCILELCFGRSRKRSPTQSEQDLQDFFNMHEEIRRAHNSPKPSVAQSLDEKVVTEPEGDKQETNVNFSDASMQYQLLIGRNLTDPTFDMHKNGFDDLATFMQRPIQIYYKVWQINESPDYSTTINPWELFLNNSKVLNKIQTFKLLHGTLRLKFLINGTQFHYGRMFVGVRPSKFDNNNITALTPIQNITAVTYRDENNAGVKTLKPGKCFYSQRPHVLLDPGTNQPQEITWPFFAQYNWIDLNDEETVNRLGRLEIWELNKLQHSNGANDSVSISCLAWMEDVKFAGLTGLAPSVAQSMTTTKKKKGPNLNGAAGRGAGEYAVNGIISGPASTVATIASYFTEVPVIGKFAKATSMASNAVGDIARLFGFSKPPILADTSFMRPQNIGNLANVAGADPVQKLSLDPKQELTVDPSTVGLTGEDQMSFGYLTKREAYIDTFNWNTTTTQNSGLLYSIRVHPCLAPVITYGSAYAYLQSPLSFVCRPFSQWSGSLRYRFQIIAAQNHRGRLLFVYEPSPSNAGSVTDTNDRFAHVVDIAEERDLTFEINWTQNEAYRDIFLDDVVNDWAIEGPVGAMTSTSADNVCNGRINVYVMTELTAPITSSNVQINVFISGGENFEVKNPRRSFGTEWAYGISEAQGLCVSKKLVDQVLPVEPPPPPPVLELGPPPPVRWEESSTTLEEEEEKEEKRSTHSSFSDRLAAYAANFPGFNRSGRLHEDADKIRDDQDSDRSYESSRHDPEFDDGQFSEAQSMNAMEHSTACENQPEHGEYYVLNGNSLSYNPQQSDVYFGESIVSFRTLLKRYNFHRMLGTTFTQATGPGLFIDTFWLWTVPVGPGPTYGSSIASALTPIDNPTQQNYNICCMTYIRYCMSAYIGYRGGIRWKYSATSSAADRTLLKVTRNTTNIFNESRNNATLCTSGYTTGMICQVSCTDRAIGGEAGGSAQTAPSVNPTLEVEFPFYSQYRYAECNETQSQSPPDNDYSVIVGQNHALGVVKWHSSGTSQNFVVLDAHVATGEDFSLFFFIGAPTLLESDIGNVVPTGS